MRKALITVFLIVLAGGVAAAGEVELEEEFTAEVGDEVDFGQDEAFEIEGIRQQALWIIPEGDVDTGHSSRLGIVDDSRMIIEWPSGEYDVIVHSIDYDNDEASIEIKPVYSESSAFDCQDYDLEEDQYAFCTNQGDEAEQQIDLGHTTAPLNFVRNAEQRSGEGLYSLFVSDGMTVQFNHEEENTWKESEIDIIEWRGLADEHGGEQQQIVIEVETAEEPDASIDFDRNEYETGEEISLEFEAFQLGQYRLEIQGAGLSELAKFEENDEVEEVTLEASEEGRLTAELVAPGSWWNPLDSDETVSTDTAEIDEDDLEDRNHAFGEVITLEEGDTTQIEGKSFHLSALMPEGALWRPHASGDTNSPLSLLRSPEDMSFRYQDESFEAYGYICEMDRDERTASIIVEEERLNPWDVCERHPSEMREDSDYSMKDYELGEVVSIEEGEGLRFGDSKVFLDDIEAWEGMWLMDGYSEWVGESGQWSPPEINYSTTDYFYEGEMATATCDVTEEEVELVMRETDEPIPDNMDWPHDWCHGPEHIEETITVDESGDTPSWGDKINVREDVELSPVYWGEGIMIEETSTRSITVMDYRAEEEFAVAESSSETTMQDYVIHLCQASTEDANIILTTGDEYTQGVCSGDQETDHIDIDLESTDNSVEVETSMDVPTPCHEVQASTDITQNEVDIVFDVVEEDERFCAQRITEKSASVSEQLESGEYEVTVEAYDAWEASESVEETVSIEDASPELEIDVEPERPEVRETVSLTVVSDRMRDDLSYEWRLEDETDTGRTVENIYETPGEKDVEVVAIKGEKEVAEAYESLEVVAPDVSSSLEVSEDSISQVDQVDITYSTGEAVARNGYTVEVMDSEGEKVIEKDESSRSGNEVFSPGQNAATGAYTARLVEDQGFLSSIMRSAFGSEAEATFEVVEESEDLSAWLEYCEELDYSHDSPSDRVSCIQDEIVSECFNEDPDSDCREVADSLCDHYVGTEFNTDEARCYR